MHVELTLKFISLLDSLDLNLSVSQPRVAFYFQPGHNYDVCSQTAAKLHNSVE